MTNNIYQLRQSLIVLYVCIIRYYFQAKRYTRENLVGREDIQKIVGALAIENSDKGVFITILEFNKGEFA
jgi:restriction endonuclease Mrr